MTLEEALRDAMPQHSEYTVGTVLDVLAAYRVEVIEHLGGQPTGQHMCSGQILHPNNEPCDDCMAVFVFPKGGDE